MKKEEFKNQWYHFCDCINFADSALDADAIRFMNEFSSRLDSVIEEEKNDVS